MRILAACMHRWFWVMAVALAGSLSFPWSPTTAQELNKKMMWVSASNPMALCNDFTRAGFFIRRNNNSNNWVVFLESGGLCYNSSTCNRRFFVKEIREEFRDTSGSVPEVIPYGQFDPARAWDETVLSGRDPTQVVSPLMTSMQCFENETNFFPNGLSSSIEGRDILDSDPANNPLYHDYNHVVIPYCSSDLWLGEETDTTEAIVGGVPECNCFNYTTRTNPNGCFSFNATSINLQFTFRGKTIYQSIIQQLRDDHGMADADRVILAGSSAGGLGVINHAKWTSSILGPTTELHVLFDSAWFVNFQDGIETIFNDPSTQHLLNILESNPACNDTDQFGYPCCISANCIMTQRDSSGQLQYYPEDIPTFALFSVYDIYLLAPGLTRVAALETASYYTSDNDGGAGVTLDFLRVATEYRGTMKYTLNLVTTQVSFLSYYVTQCFQHIYLATSTLWGEEGQSVFGSDSLEFTRGITSFSHIIASGRWTTQQLSASGTILDALTAWSELNGNGTVKFTDPCRGVFCNSQCPDELILQELTSNSWPVWSKIVIIVLVVGLAIICMTVKAAFTMWVFWLERKQDVYLDSLKGDEEETDAKLQFPVCEDDDAVAVSCLDLCYSVKFKAKKALKDERKDQTAPIVLSNIAEDDSDSEPEDGYRRTHRRSPPLSRRRSLELDRPFLSRNDSQLESPLKPMAIQHPVVISPVKERKKTFSRPVKQILKGISLYFNPGEVVGIMGPSGCGKTTLLDLLTARRKIQGEIYINGIPIAEIHDWYVANTGYVLQLAAPYYEELTVRENLTLAAQMKLPKTFTLREKFERVEQVMKVTGLQKLASTRVSGSVRTGLSRGQRKLLVVAIQLLKFPSVIFLDEPTSGVDDTASFELLTHLNKLADSNRTVILTIHQPRLEIFHMFHRLVLLSDGKIAYQGAPEKAYEVFVNALTSRYLEQGLIIPSLEDHNPADVIMDMLGNLKMRQIITENYQSSVEPKLIRNAIIRGRLRVHGHKNTTNSILRRVLTCKSIKEHHNGRSFTQMATLDATVSKRISFWTLIYFLCMFFSFGFGLGTTYIQVNQALLVVAGACAFSTASAFIMFPAMYYYYGQALEVYDYHRIDGVGHPHNIVLQGFIRFTSFAFFPVIISATMLYLLLVNANSYDLFVYFQVTLTNVALNQTWIALLISLICAFPRIAFRISPVISAVAGFTSGFFIPVGVLHWGYRWIVYINPIYYAFSSMTFFVLSEFQTDCVGNQLVCYIRSSPFVLGQFFFDDINPYLHLIVLFSFAIFYLLLAIFANWMRINFHLPSLTNKKRVDSRRSMNTSEEDNIMKIEESSDQIPYFLVEDDEEEDEFEELGLNFMRQDSPKLQDDDVTENQNQSNYLRGGEIHQVWKPRTDELRRTPRVGQSSPQEQTSTPQPAKRTKHRTTFKEAAKSIMADIREQKESKLTFADVAMHVMAEGKEQKEQLRLHVLSDSSVSSQDELTEEGTYV